MKFSNKDIELFNEAGICVEDKIYTINESNRFYYEQKYKEYKQI